MKNVLDIVIIVLIVIIVIILGIMIYLKLQKCSIKYFHLGKDGFEGGTKISCLKQSKDFYMKNKDQTLKYLLGVYPAGAESLKKLSALELASLFNSLWFYYNCAGEYKGDDLESLTGNNDDKTWGPLPCKSTFPLPYAPQGWLYNFWTYNKYNVPEINSNSDNSIEYLKVENASSNRAGVMGTYKSPKLRSSGVMWYPQRSIQRDIWYPNGLYNDKKLREDQPDNWITTRVGSTPEFNFIPNWFGGLKDNHFIEITHGPANTGDAINQSPWWWYNGCVGSGIFLNLGKTLAVKNKVAGIFEQVKLLAKTKSGKETLMKWYNTIDPYTITFGVVGLCGYNSVTKQKYCDFTKLACGEYCKPQSIGYANAAGLKNKLLSFYDETVKYQNMYLDELSKVPTEKGIKTAIDLAVSNKNYEIAHISEQLIADETMFFLGINLGLDTLQLYEDPNGNDNYCFEMIDMRIPEKYKKDARNRDYSGFMNITNNGKPWSKDAQNNSYKKECIDEYLKEAYDKNWLSVRDPFDISNESKVQKCKGVILSNVCKDAEGKPITAHSMYCENVPLANSYKCLALGNEFTQNTCVLNGPDPTC